MSAPPDDAFVREHEPLVRKIAHRVIAQLDLRTELEDLVAYGMHGLLQARERFDETRGVQFTTFAHYRIRGAILDGVRQMARLPASVHTQRRAAEAFDAVAEAALESRAANPEQTKDVIATLRAVDEILGKTCAAFVIAAVGQADDQAPPSSEQTLIAGEDRERVRAALDVLPERERTLIEGYYFQGRTLDEMGKEMGITKSWASRLHSRALGLLRDALGER